MITVTCVLKSGGIYNADWVRKLRNGVVRHLSLPHRFVCLSDIDVPCERIPLVEDWQGWWSKIELFRPDLFDGLVLYLDLDSVVVGSLDTIADYDHRFTGSHDFYGDNFCSTAMVWNGDYSYIYTDFKLNSAAIAHHYDNLLRTEQRIGDQAFIEDCLKNSGIAPAQFRHVTSDRFIASYKVHECRDSPPADAAVVSFHGYPKPHDLQRGWVPALWR